MRHRIGALVAGGALVGFLGFGGYALAYAQTESPTTPAPTTPAPTTPNTPSTPAPGNGAQEGHDPGNCPNMGGSGGSSGSSDSSSSYSNASRRPSSSPRYMNL
jgi:hypothetical protein